MLTLDVLRVVASALLRVVYDVAFMLCEELRIQLDNLGYALAERSAREVARVVLLFVVNVALNVTVLLFIAALCCFAYFVVIPATLYVAHWMELYALYFARGAVYNLSLTVNNLSNALYALYLVLFRYNP